MENFNQPVRQDERIFALDTIRGFALCGILILNIGFFGRPWQAGFNLNVYQETSWLNIATWYITNFLFEGSFRGLFSMLFGAGMILLVTRMEKTAGIQAADIYYRRLIWLLIFGLINAHVLLWPGDILFHYAICGLFIFPFRHSSVKLLVGIAIFFIAVTMFKSWLSETESLTMRDKGIAALSIKEARRDSLSDEQKGDLEKWNGYLEKQKIENKRKDATKEIEKMSGSFTVVWNHLEGFNQKIESVMFYQSLFFDAMIFILLGMALFKMNVLSGDRSIWLYVIFVVVGYSIGLGAGFVMGNEWRQANFNFYQFVDIRKFPVDTYQVHRVFVTLGHIGTIILLWKSRVFNWLLKPFSYVGQMAFTNYLMQSVICTLFFYGYGFGYYGKLQRYELWYVVFAVWVFQIIFSALWLRFFRFGPLEWVWRSLTYWKIQPIRKV